MNMKSETFQIASDIQWEDAGDGVVRQIMAYDDNLMMVKVKCEQGAVGPIHQHPHTQSTYVASGCFEVTIGDEKKTLKAGDGYYVAPNLPHGCVCLEAGILIDTFTPMRKDFLK
ncbi:Cupin domain protein [Xylanibacter ruminicola]|uniref:Cupin domain protein n=1 Tax=Xylanibacter ruminicola TaxID=839 RepID=A0A1M7CQJ1_XYLRU|nr:cupin domain-containing protein [Xylanibacter ruminicola]SHL69333.1 Cupin domain protein [Xylanibacter ruminicola]